MLVCWAADKDWLTRASRHKPFPHVCADIKVPWATQHLSSAAARLNASLQRQINGLTYRYDRWQAIIATVFEANHVNKSSLTTFQISEITFKGASRLPRPDCG